MALHPDIQQSFEVVLIQARDLTPNWVDRPLHLANRALREIAGAFKLTSEASEALREVDIALQEIAADPNLKEELMGRLQAALGHLEQQLSDCPYDEVWAIVH